MWIDLFVHRTTAEHESRWVSVINPATEYAFSDPLLVSTLVALFLTGIELSLSTLFKQQLNHILANPLSSQLSATDHAYMIERASFFGNYISKSVEFLGQLAQFFDLHNASGAFLPRPGKESQPDLNMTDPYFSFLKVVSCSGADSNPTPWPSRVLLWPNTEAVIRKHSDTGSLVPWAKGMPIQLGSTLISVEHLIPLPNVVSMLENNNTSLQNSPSSSGRTGTSVIRRAGLQKEASDISEVETWLSQVEPNSPPVRNGSGLVSTNRRSRNCRSGASSTDSSLDAECESDPVDLAQLRSVGTNSNSDDSDKDSAYPVEALISHRPPISDRSKVRSYKIAIGLIWNEGKDDGAKAQGSGGGSIEGDFLRT
ncbi:hypothetical protein SLS62_000714 [Diatrype stigma]|uniref:Uncharacterized protein n=1 Tax=Diatrype stigma TaxID=117547 RepID=A0AAN9V311_9PEZI